MADWREGSDPKPARKRSVPEPAATPSNAPGNAPGNASGSSDWRGTSKAHASKTRTPSRERTWSGQEAAPVRATGFRRRAFVTVSAIAIPLLCIWFVRHVFLDPPRLPLLVSMPTIYAAPELTENPFGFVTVDAFRETNGGNIQLVTDLTTSGNQQQDTLLDNLRKNDNWQKKYEHQKLVRQGDKIVGGGPDRNVVAVYLSGYVVTKRIGQTPTTVELVSVDGQPYGGEQSQGETVAIGELLSRIVNAVASGSKVWISLDVRSVPVIANLGDLECPLEENVREWFNRLPQADQDRTIVTLPCKDTQDNWLAPELSSTVFGHFYRMGLAGAFDKGSILKNAVSLDELQTELTRRVEQWVRDHRFAHQTPQWIMSEQTSNQAATISIVSTDGDQQLPAIRPYPTDNPFEPRYRAVDRRWETLHQLGQAYRWDPLAYAETESQLIRLEDLVESNADSQSWGDINARIDSSFERLKKSISPPPRVSLIENHNAGEYYQRRFLQFEHDNQQLETEAELWRRLPPWRALPASAESGNSQAAPSPSFQQASRDERCYLVFRTLQQHAAADDEVLWENSFNRAALDWCLNHVGPAPADEPDWLEIQLLRLMLHEVDWQNDELTDKSGLGMRSQACARLWRCFSVLQEVGTNPNHELSWWLRQRVLEVEQGILDGFDLLAADQYETSKTKLLEVDRQLETLQREAQILEEAMQRRDEAAWLTPHLLAWLLREYQFVEETGDTEQALEKLGMMVATSQKLNTLLRPIVSNGDAAVPLDLQNSSLFDASQTLSELIEEQHTLFENYITGLKRLPKGNPQSIRNYRIALRSPLLDSNSREQFHNNLTTYFTRPVKDADADLAESQEKKTNISEHQVKPAINSFLKHLKEADSSTVTYEALARGDQRLQILPELANTSASASSNLGDILSALYTSSYQIRILALSFGAHTSFRAFQSDWLNEWPWSATRQFSMLNHLRYSQMQVQRLAQAKWGDRELASVNSAQQLYFHRLAQQYRHGGELRPLAPTSGLDPSFIRQSDRPLQEAVEQIQKLLVKFNDGSGTLRPNSKAQVLKFSVPSGRWPALPAVYLGRGQRAPLQKSVPQKRLQAIDLNSDSDLYEIEVDAAQADGRELVIALRGHYRAQRLAIASVPQTENRTTSFDRRKLDSPTIKVVNTKATPTTIMVLFDCSQSMQKRIVDPSNPGQTAPAFDLAKMTASRLIRAIEEIHQSQETEVRLGLVLFGLRKHEEGKLPQILQSNTSASNQTYFTTVERPDKSFADELQSLINDPVVQPWGCTPLYDAIAIAVEQSKSESALIYVVSDGFNDVTSSQYKGMKSTANSVRQLLGKNRILHIFQFSTDFYSDKEGATDEQAEAELVSLTQNRYVRSSSFEELKEKLLEALPRSRVSIHSGKNVIAEGAFGSKIVVPISEADGVPLRLEVRATVGSSTENQSKTQTVQLVGDEDLRLEFDKDSARLKFIDLSSEDQSFDRAPARPTSIVKDANELDLRIGALPSLEQSLGESGTLSFQIALSHIRERDEFTPRPTLVLGRLAEVGQSPDTDFLIADSRFKPERHYPIFSLPKFPWRRTESGTAPNARLSLWLAFDNIKFEFPPASIADGEARKTLPLDVTLERDRNKVIVHVPQPKDPSDRLFVVCPQAESAVRQYSSEDLSETHTFTLFNSVTGPATVQLITIGHLERAVNNESIMEVEFSDLKLSRTDDF